MEHGSRKEERSERFLRPAPLVTRDRLDTLGKRPLWHVALPTRSTWAHLGLGELDAHGLRDSLDGCLQLGVLQPSRAARAAVYSQSIVEQGQVLGLGLAHYD
jgi:hypothetical protein